MALGEESRPGQQNDDAEEFEDEEQSNKYAIYAYTHGPVTGSGPSVKPLKYDVAPYWLS